MIASTTYWRGNGNSTVYARIRNALGQYNVIGTNVWQNSDTDGTTKAYLTEHQDNDTVESRYSSTVAVPTGGPWVLEYFAGNERLGEESTPPDVATTSAPTATDNAVAVWNAATRRLSLDPPTTSDIDTALTLTHGPGSWKTGSGGGSSSPDNITVNHNYPITDNLRYVSPAGAGVDNAVIEAYLTSEYAAGSRNIITTSATMVDGRWANDMKLDPGLAYTIVFYKQGEYGITSVEITT
jgi:hypothetical protein